MIKYKNVIIFAATFMIVAFVDMVIFSGLFSQILVGKLAWILNNTVISLLLFFWMFIGFPSLSAYFIAFILLKTKKIGTVNTEIDLVEAEVTEKILEKKQLKIAAFATIILGVLITALIRWTTQARFLPYTFHSIEPGELTESSTPTIVPSPTSSQAISSTPTVKAQVSVTVVPTVKLRATSIPDSPTPPPKSTCSINVQATPLDPNSNFDNPLTVLLTYSVNPVGNKYMIGAQWDFEGNGSWDTDMSQANGSISHTYSSNGSYNVKLQLKMSDGEITPACTKTVTVPMGITVSLTGKVFSDVNCNGRLDPDEKGMPGITVNIFRIPEFSIYTAIISDSNGNYNFTKVISLQGSLSIQPGDVADPYYSIETSRNSVTLNSSQLSINQDLPEVPNEKLSACGQ